MAPAAAISSGAHAPSPGREPRRDHRPVPLQDRPARAFERAAIRLAANRPLPTSRGRSGPASSRRAPPPSVSRSAQHGETRPATEIGQRQQPPNPADAAIQRERAEGGGSSSRSGGAWAVATRSPEPDRKSSDVLPCAALRGSEGLTVIRRSGVGKPHCVAGQTPFARFARRSIRTSDQTNPAARADVHFALDREGFVTPQGGRAQRLSNGESRQRGRKLS